MIIQGGTQRPKPSGAGTGPWYMDPYLWMNLAGTAADTWASTSSAHQANRTNIQLQREQRDWQEDMSNTEIQRRKRDLELAGGNPALAFTEGQGASSPGVAAPHVEPEYKGGLGNIGSAALVAAQLKNLNAQTELTRETTRGKGMTNNILNAFGSPMAQIKHDTAMTMKQSAQLDYDQRTETFPLAVRKLKQEIYNLGISGQQSAAELDRFRRTSDAIVALAVQQAEAGEFNVDALRAVAAQGGVEGKLWMEILEKAMGVLGPLLRRGR